jgi:methylthioribose-1-phosphate isomerase
VASLLDVWERAGAPREGAAARLLEAARALERYETTASEGIARAGADLLGDRTRFLTHCNAGALVTVGLGTALAPVYLLHARGRPVQVWVDETRPLLQGLRLTAFELGEAGIPHRVLVDGAAAGLIARGAVDAVLVGADRICRNGDVLNKVGTYGLALAARAHAVPFVVLAPLSTLDPALPGGSSATVEERPADLGRYLAAEALPRDVETWGPAFDVTPAALVSAWVTERGWTRDPGAAGLGAWMAAAGGLQAGGGTGR